MDSDRTNSISPLPLEIQEKFNFIEKEEPLLQDNPGRFVLFPINYEQFGKCISKSLDYFGLLKKSI